jgi:hypothetical protein
MFTKDQLLKMNLLTIQAQGYIYDLSKGGTAKFNPSNKRSPMPSRGSRLNCQAAADLLIDMCKADQEENEVVFNLIRVYYKSGTGFMVLGAAGLMAFGTNLPPLGTGPIKCWEFENHYRVLDRDSGTYYDPTFGTMGADNPVGIIGTDGGSKTENKITSMWSVYGNKYKVERSIGNMAPPDMVTDLFPSVTLDERFKVKNSDFS